MTYYCQFENLMIQTSLWFIVFLASIAMYIIVDTIQKIQNYSFMDFSLLMFLFVADSVIISVFIKLAVFGGTI